MGAGNKKIFRMTDQNSTVEHQIRPSVLQDQLGIKKDAYYTYLKHLGIKAQKDSKNKAYLTEAQAKLIRELRKYVVDGGKIEDFQVPEKIVEEPIKKVEAVEEVSQPEEVPQPEAVALAVADPSELGSLNDQPDPEAEAVDPSEGLDMQVLYREASAIAAQRLTTSEQLVLAMASQMGYEDLHPEAKTQVDRLRSAAAPKFNAQKVAANLLSKCKQQVQAVA